MYKYVWYCRWCGNVYKPKGETDRDGFCSSKHKQAHYRAYLRYVTLQAHVAGSLVNQGVTPSKAKQKGKTHGKKKKKSSR